MGIDGELKRAGVEPVPRQAAGLEGLLPADVVWGVGVAVQATHRRDRSTLEELASESFVHYFMGGKSRPEIKTSGTSYLMTTI